MNPNPTLPILSLSPLRLTAQPAYIKAIAVMLGTFFLAAASWIAVPMIPVPMNMQTFAIVTIGALYGCRLGTVTVLLWLMEGAVGLPVFSGFAAGMLHFVGPTGGYLFSFPLMACFIGWLADRGWYVLANPRKPISPMMRAFFTMLAAHLLCLALGAAWLAVMIGSKSAFVVGVLPFLSGSILKSALATATITIVDTVRRSYRSYRKSKST